MNLKIPSNLKIYWSSLAHWGKGLVIFVIVFSLMSGAFIVNHQIKAARGIQQSIIQQSQPEPTPEPEPQPAPSSQPVEPLPPASNPEPPQPEPKKSASKKVSEAKPESAPAEPTEPAVSQPTAEPSPPPKKTYPTVKTSRWGVSLSPFPYYQETQAALEESVQLAAGLGVTIIRLDYPVNWSYLEPWQPTLVDSIRSRGIDVVMSFQPPKTYETDNPWQDGFDLGKKIAREFGGKVTYQLGNEICGNAVKPGWPGTTKEAFYEDKLEKVRAWVKGASAAVSQYAPGAIQATTGHWLHFWCANEILNGDGGIPNIKILGWDWFNDRNQDLTAIKSGDEVINLVEKLQEIGRELWIMESGNERGGYGGEELQAEYLERFANHIAGTKAFKAFFSFYLHDDANKILNNPNDGSRGLIRININEHGHYSLGGLKPAYDRYKGVIAKNK